MPLPETILSVEAVGPHLTIHWPWGGVDKFPFIFLRDNCPCCRHANGQKLMETTDIPLDIMPRTFMVNDEEKTLAVVWEQDGHTSVYSFEWLQKHRLGGNSIEEKKDLQRNNNGIALWDAEMNNQLPESDYWMISSDDTALAEWLGFVQQYGFGILRNVPAEMGMVLKVVDLFGYARETNYGKLFDVKTVVNPNNLAYTGLSISPHTDNPYREPVPTLQLLHCLSSTADGGDSILVDGFKAAEDLCRLHPHHFSLLNSTPVTFRFKDKDNWLERTAPIIETGSLGHLSGINFNNRSVQPFELPDERMVDFYGAYITFAKMLEDKKYQVRFKMESGDLYMVNNRRILHARSAYNNTGGERWLQGAYADIDGLMSKWRILSEPRFGGI